MGIGEFGVFGYWMNSYWGGALTTAGGSLVLGALPRLVRKPKLSAAVLGSIGLVILLNTRPYEGGVLSLAAGAALVWWRTPPHRQRSAARSPHPDSLRADMRRGSGLDGLLQLPRHGKSAVDALHFERADIRGHANFLS